MIFLSREKVILLVFIFSSSCFLFGQETTLAWPKIQDCRVEIIFSEEGSEYKYNIKVFHENCTATPELLQDFARRLADQLIVAHSGLDTISSKLRMKVNEKGYPDSLSREGRSNTFSQTDSLISQLIEREMPIDSPIISDELLLFIANEENLVFTLAAEAAAFPGGKKELKLYLQKNLEFPKEAIKKGVEGRVFVQFLVEKDGSLSDVKVVRGIGAGCDEEAVKLIKEMPAWKPGKNEDGKPIRQKYVQSILFKKSKY